MAWIQIIGSLGVSAFVFSLILFFITRHFNRKDKKRDEQEQMERKAQEEKEREKEKRIDERLQRLENLLFSILASQKGTYTLACATAKAVQRIPDAKCNGDMKKALEEAEEYNKKETELLITLGVQSLNH